MKLQYDIDKARSQRVHNAPVAAAGGATGCVVASSDASSCCGSETAATAGGGWQAAPPAPPLPSVTRPESVPGLRLATATSACCQPRAKARASAAVLLWTLPPLPSRRSLPNASASCEQQHCLGQVNLSPGDAAS